MFTSLFANYFYNKSTGTESTPTTIPSYIVPPLIFAFAQISTASHFERIFFYSFVVARRTRILQSRRFQLQIVRHRGGRFPVATLEPFAVRSIALHAQCIVGVETEEFVENRWGPVDGRVIGGSWAAGLDAGLVVISGKLGEFHLNE